MVKFNNWVWSVPLSAFLFPSHLVLWRWPPKYLKFCFSLISRASKAWKRRKWCWKLSIFQWTLKSHFPFYQVSNCIKVLSEPYFFTRFQIPQLIPLKNHRLLTMMYIGLYHHVAVKSLKWWEKSRYTITDT